MEKYIINHKVDSYETKEITDKCLLDGEGNIVVLVLDETTSDKLLEYYEFVTNVLLSKNRLYLIVIGKESKIRKAICNLVVNYRNYNVYKVDSKGTVDEEYIDTIIEREPSITEVQTFIGGDIAGYSSISSLMLGINDYVNNGDLDGLKNYIEENVTSIESLVEVVEYMKKIVDITNSKELLNKIDELKESLKGTNEKLDNVEDENNKIKDENLRLTETNATIKGELAKLMTKNKELENQVSSSGGSSPIIQSYAEIKTSLIKCKATNIIYFKEVSYVPYVNTLVTTMLGILKIRKKRVKLIIYDSRVGLSGVYKPLSIIGGNEFVASKDNFVSHVESFVVIEPNPVILTSVLENINPALDVVIVYDRMRQPTNLVSGNNVVNFYVINSSKDYKEVQDKLKITDKSSIITRAGSSIGPETLNIPKIDGFSTGTESARQSKYMKLVSDGNNKQLIKTLLDKARIDLK